MDIEKLKQAMEIAALLDCDKATCEHTEKPVLVWTDRRGVIFGYTKDEHARPIRLDRARMALYWSKDVGGVFGLAENGPTSGCKISAELPSATFEGVTGVASVSDAAVKAWTSAPVQGR